MDRIRKNLLDVARLAGVSPSTVSRVINEKPFVNNKTRKKVQEAIKKLDYIPNAAARSLVTGVNKNFLLYIIQENPITPATWRFELPIIQGIYNYINLIEYSLYVSIFFFGDVDNPDIFLNKAINKNIDGLLILSAWKIPGSSLTEFLHRKIPFVIVGADSDLESVCSVKFDNYNAMSNLVKTLINLGHKKIALISGFKKQQHMNERINAFKKTIIDEGLELYDSLIYYGNYRIEGGYKVMNQILGGRIKPTAVVCGNDFLAIGAMKAAMEHGLEIPRDISITGFDDSELASIYTPSLTSVKIPLFDLGYEAVNLLYSVVAKKEKDNKEIVLPCEIVMRSSIGSCRQA